MDVDSLSDVEEISIKNKEWLRLIEGPGFPHILAGPAFELFSVKIYCNSFSEGNTCEVYGEISIEDEDGTRVIYCRDLDDAQALTQDDSTLSLEMLDECAAWKTWVIMTISLKDKFDDSVIIDEVVNLDRMSKLADYDKVNVRQVQGPGGCAYVTYAAFLTAILASVQIRLFKSDGLPVANDVYGRIVARYGNTYGKSFPGITLFNKPSGEVYESPLVLTRPVLAVPAYSFIRIDVDLYDSHTNQPLVNGNAEFLASHFMNFQKGNIQAEDILVQLNVNWFHSYEAYQLEREVVQLFKRSKVSYDQLLHPSLTTSISRGPFLRKHQPIGCELVEVFTLMIGHNSNNELNVCGKVRVHDNWKKCKVFKRDKSNPEILSANMQTIPIEGPSECFIGPGILSIEPDLWDDQGHILIKGRVGWTLDFIERSTLWYDSRLCSVCRGVGGYAAVFYTIFSRAVQVLVKALFLFNGFEGVSHNVHGTIVARYSTEDYSTEYESEYYKSVLFKNRREKNSELRSGSTIPLLKSVVAVPRDASLIVEVDLYAKPLLAGLPEEHLKDVKTFDIQRDSRVSHVIVDNKCGIELSVDWSKLDCAYL